MGNRSRYITAAATATALVASRRWARLRQATAGIGDTILPSRAEDLSTDVPPGTDEAHAAGHQHLVPADDGDRPPARLRGRPWTKNLHGMRHPFSGD
jgi:hypothetical protein